MIKRWMLFSLIGGLVISCHNSEDNFSEIKQIGYGTSFGMCVGYCTMNIQLTPEKVVYSRSGWNDQVAPISCSDNVTKASWNSLVNGIDFKEIVTLPEIIGCPDCADGGAEWVELEFSSGQRAKITFEYGNEPENLEMLINKLREQQEKAINCGEFLKKE
ncbi:hypothetical protein KCTC52924_00475 [Arenibacter antarcticus]|uniref:NlpE N-terminal domain-containing protein n=1 Tax=Arenibacter antarcticus TaxID=2040469 RepID=A0ABW5VDH7_9FLAO|nr:hypothetical protein [Arenibacter sp. H213]MCM4169440.1 hypothetical protein [Arenibacter sp. H213]